MRHFCQLEQSVLNRLFLRVPQPFGDADHRDRLAVALGATLYVPATRSDLTATIMRRAGEGVMSMVLDLEDAVADDEVEKGLRNAVATLDELAARGAAPMLLFIRVRTADGIDRIASVLGAGVQVLTGFVLPKFTADSGRGFLDAVSGASERLGKTLYAMPVIESTSVVHRETRDDELRAISQLLAEHRPRVLAVRIGATDMCGAFGIRRDRDLTIYDVRVIVDVIADIVNYLGRTDGTGFVITGPVWEYFADHERMFRPMLRATPFAEHDAVLFRQQLVSRDLDGLLREIALDRANGIQGKTVIHPSHVAAVHALSAVTHEEFHDAVDILDTDTGGVQASGYGNKMNERRPHRTWAQQTLLRASVFGVTNKGVTFVDLLTALVDR
ncbi:HpcH/HpaI aldolase/citrate lyase family protein [Rhodococcus chondri]|uniref:HpcH/HpaI aldolase/citrate lyase family protein n=1 Tax=Rhodococcus chondri TaxID=3065941 RepID=A0ABU7JKJ3_9NOCA|nr:HpcH/HpaI aldolase/citrate lyase family protein [Rhodococcus sp. CC-R104]MEE2030563.1 HpcH/HpaI aldolase/citrate lyase family protein [Rhodococcus sp. CC-R104]